MYALRALNLLASGLTVAACAVLLYRHTHDARLVWGAAASLVLVPQWSAILAMAGNDAAATLMATLAVWLVLAPPANGRSPAALAATGLVAGLALSTKLTAAYLVPLSLVAAWWPPTSSSRGGAGRPIVRVALIVMGLCAGAGWIVARNWWVFGDPLASGFKRTILEQSGFVAPTTARADPFDPAFWLVMRVHVFEAFWARFGSLGAGPDTASRIWLLYQAISLVVAMLLGAGFARGAEAWRHRHRGGGDAAWSAAVAATGVLAGVAIWVVTNVANRPDVVVHWTPRHVLPLTAPALLLAAIGVTRMRQLPLPSWCWRGGAALALVSLAVGWLVSLRHAIQQFWLGF